MRVPLERNANSASLLRRRPDYLWKGGWRFADVDGIIVLIQGNYPMNIGTNLSQAGREKKPARHLILKRLLAPLIMAAIWFLSSQSTLPQPKGIIGFDKIQHFIAYFVLAAAAGLWFSPDWWQKRAWKPLLISFAAASFYGFIDEVHQHFVPGRDANVWDWLADSIGAVFGGMAVCCALRIKPRKSAD